MIKIVGSISYASEPNFDVEAYAQLFNAKPVVVIVTEGGMPFKVGTLDSNMVFERMFSFSKRTEAIAQFARLCSNWADVY